MLRTALLSFWILLVLGGLWAELWKEFVGRNTAEDWVHFFGLSYEQNLPTWYSSSVLVLCGASLLQIGQRCARFAQKRPGPQGPLASRREDVPAGGQSPPATASATPPEADSQPSTFNLQPSSAWQWYGLSAVFFYISLDEFATLHENLNQYFDFGGFLYFGWVVPAASLLLVLGLIYLPFLGKLERHTRRQFLLAAALYVGGALGVELILGWWTDYAGSKNLTYGLIDLVEESMEIAGASVFFHELRRVLSVES